MDALDVNKGALSGSFHIWRTLCTFTPPRAGDYYLQVRSDVAMQATANQDDGSYQPPPGATENSKVFTQTGDDTNVKGNGTNRYAVRAFLTDSPQPAGAVSVSAFGRMPIYANADAASTTFNLIRVLPAGVGKTMLFTFFDLGDAGGEGTLKILPPTESTGTTLSGCQASGYKPQALPDCSLSGVSSTKGWNGKTETIAVPIPSTYTCNYDSPGGCWFRVNVSFGQQVTDTTTWTANITGDPVRLVE